jgi:hypothetical protein
MSRDFLNSPSHPGKKRYPQRILWKPLSIATNEVAKLRRLFRGEIRG